MLSTTNRLDFEFEVKMDKPTMIYKDDHAPVDTMKRYLKALKTVEGTTPELFAKACETAD